MYVTIRERATVLAALRYWQRTSFHQQLPEDAIATDNDTLDPLTYAEIDVFCERLGVISERGVGKT